jgi:hypothetical protein
LRRAAIIREVRDLRVDGSESERASERACGRE